MTASQDGHVKFWKKLENDVEFVKHFRAHLGKGLHKNVGANMRIEDRKKEECNKLTYGGLQFNDLKKDVNSILIHSCHRAFSIMGCCFFCLLYSTNMKLQERLC